MAPKLTVELQLSRLLLALGVDVPAMRHRGVSDLDAVNQALDEIIKLKNTVRNQQAQLVKMDDELSGKADGAAHIRYYEKHEVTRVAKRMTIAVNDLQRSAWGSLDSSGRLASLHLFAATNNHFQVLRDEVLMAVVEHITEATWQGEAGEVYLESGLLIVRGGI